MLDVPDASDAPDAMGVPDAPDASDAYGLPAVGCWGTERSVGSDIGAVAVPGVKCSGSGAPGG
ncbi:hypothetical protein [Streptomyces cinnamoneus]|uniref:hypothetical protein n=1 Tax=Streptomyces cinnamoneus TaxID=53446 RepID=UPI001E3E95D4|nr:hypothetical protein [Streptomyces cinnamoneus]